MSAASAAAQPLRRVLGGVRCNNDLRGVRYDCLLPLKTTTTTPYLDPDAMVHVLLTLNEPLAAA